MFKFDSFVLHGLHWFWILLYWSDCEENLKKDQYFPCYTQKNVFFF